MGCGSSKKESKNKGTMDSSDSEDDYTDDEEGEYREDDSGRNSRKSSHTSAEKVGQSESEGYHSTNRTEEELLSNLDKQEEFRNSPDLFGLAEEAAAGERPNNPPESPISTTKKNRTLARKKKRNTVRTKRKSKHGYESEPEPNHRAEYVSDDEADDDRGYISEPEHSSRKKSNINTNASQVGEIQHTSGLNASTQTFHIAAMVRKKRKRGRGSKNRSRKWNPQQSIPRGPQNREVEHRKKSPNRQPRVAGGKNRKGQPPPIWKPWNDPTKNEFKWKTDYPGDPVDW